jgi:lysophospholipase L1-like esterase
MMFTMAGAIALHVLSAAALQMASLGSSFAAGPGLPTGGNYARLLAAKIHANISDLSVSGSTLLSMSSQIDRLPRNADIITITSGGNDLGYIGGLAGDSMGGSARPGAASVRGRSADMASISEQQLVGRFNDALAKVRTKAPKAKVYLVEYLTILGPDTKPGVNVPFNQARVEHHRGVAATLQRATAMAADGKDWVERVPVAHASQSHGIGSPETWVNGNKAGKDGGVAWHPTATGMKAIAQMLYDRIEKRTRTT